MTSNSATRARCLYEEYGSLSRPRDDHNVADIVFMANLYCDEARNMSNYTVSDVLTVSQGVFLQKLNFLLVIDFR